MTFLCRHLAHERTLLRTRLSDPMASSLTLKLPHLLMFKGVGEESKESLGVRHTEMR
jgi:hypothetical protein